MNGRNLLIWGLVFVFFIILLQSFKLSSPGPQAERLSYSEFVAQIDAGGVKTAEINQGNVKGVLASGKSFVTAIPEGSGVAVADRLNQSGAQTKITPEEELPLHRRIDMGAYPQRPQRMFALNFLTILSC